MTVALTARAPGHAALVAVPNHDALYECCAALIIAVMVVLYFDERVRRDLSLRMRGYTIGSLGGVIGTGLLVPLFALAGFIGDTTAVRMAVVGYTLVFLAAAFSVAIRSWAREDVARLQAARPAELPRLPVPVPRPGMTEREHAAQVLGTAMSIMAQCQPDAVLMHLGRTGPGLENERLAGLTAQWYALQPALMAISAGYPSMAVRDRVRTFFLAAIQTIQQPAILFSQPDLLADKQAQVQWRDQAVEASEAAERAWNEVVSALHVRKTAKAKAYEADSAKNGHTDSIPNVPDSKGRA